MKEMGGIVSFTIPEFSQSTNDYVCKFSRLSKFQHYSSTQLVIMLLLESEFMCVWFPPQH